MRSARARSAKVDRRQFALRQAESMNEFMTNPGRSSPRVITIDGLEFLSRRDASSGVSEIFESQRNCIWGT